MFLISKSFSNRCGIIHLDAGLLVIETVRKSNILFIMANNNEQITKIKNRSLCKKRL